MKLRLWLLEAGIGGLFSLCILQDNGQASSSLEVVVDARLLRWVACHLHIFHTDGDMYTFFRFEPLPGATVGHGPRLLRWGNFAFFGQAVECVLGISGYEFERS